jgi:hypothetical protein
MPSHGVSLGMPEAFVHDTSRMNREVHVRLCRLARAQVWGGHLAFFDRATTLAVGIMNRKAVIYSVPLGMAHRSAATARSWPSPITNSLPATPRHKESSRPACRPVGGQMYCRWRDSPRMPSVFGRQQRPRWSDPGHPAGCRDSIIPPNRDAWRLPGPDRHIARPALRRSRLGETCGVSS